MAGALEDVGLNFANELEIKVLEGEFDGALGADFEFLHSDLDVKRGGFVQSYFATCFLDAFEDFLKSFITPCGARFRDLMHSRFFPSNSHATMLPDMTYKGKKKSNVYASQEGYDLYAQNYDASLGFLSSFEGNRLLEVLGDLRGMRVLDLGCGTGRLVRDLRNLGATVVGTDLSEGMLAVARKKYDDVEFVRADAANLPFKDGEFDLVISTFFIVHLRNLQPVFDEVYRVLKDRGNFILTNINQRRAPKLKTADGEIVIKSFYHRPSNVVAALEESFFKIEREEFIMDEKVWVNQIVKASKA